jgi:hypothetical protein
LALNKAIKDVINTKNINSVFNSYVIITYLRQVYISYKNQSLQGLCVLNAYNLCEYCVFYIWV